MLTTIIATTFIILFLCIVAAALIALAFLMLFLILVVVRLFRSGVGTPYCIWPLCSNKTEIDKSSFDEEHYWQCEHHRRNSIHTNERVGTWILRCYIIASIILSIVLYNNMP